MCGLGQQPSVLHHPRCRWKATLCHLTSAHGFRKCYKNQLVFNGFAYGSIGQMHRSHIYNAGCETRNCHYFSNTCAVCAFLLTPPRRLRRRVIPAADPRSPAKGVGLATDSGPDPIFRTTNQHPTASHQPPTANQRQHPTANNPQPTASEKPTTNRQQQRAPSSQQPAHEPTTHYRPRPPPPKHANYHINANACKSHKHGNACQRTQSN